jgi:hypothetical protein
MPRQISFSGERFILPQNGLILLDAPQPQTLRGVGERIQAALQKAGGLAWQLSASPTAPLERVPLTLRIAPERTAYPQGYRLHVTGAGISIEGHDPAGVFYGACTLVQMIDQMENGALACVEIHDWPDIAARGVMLDISRDKVYRMDYLYELVDRLAGWKINQLQLYTEHTFAYENHQVVWEKASPMTGEEIMALDAFCRERYIELVPNQNSFGHMERWLVHSQYAGLAETHDWYDTPWGGLRLKGPFSLAPEHPGSLPLVTGLYDDLLPHFTSNMFNVGCDETIDLGQGVSKDLCAARGKGRVYFDFLMRIYADVKRRGMTMQFWGDIINNDHPELAALLPRDVVALNWGYEAVHPFNVESARFAESGVPFYVCPGTSSWCSLAGRTDNALANLVNAAENGIRYGAIGYLNTDWGDRGHWQVPPVSFLGFAAGAAYSWALEANRSADMAELTSRFAFEDPTGAMGKVAYDLGNIYQVPETPVGNGSVLFWALQLPVADITRYTLNRTALERTLEAVDAAVAPLERAPMGRPDAEIIRREFRNTARILRHGAQRALLALDGGADEARCRNLAADLSAFLEEYRALWLERARPGGLDDSAARFEQALADYSA